MWQKISLKESYGTHSPLSGAQLFNGPELVIQITNYSNNQIFELGSHHSNETNLIYLKQFTTNADHPRHLTAKDGHVHAEYAI